MQNVISLESVRLGQLFYCNSGCIFFFLKKYLQWYSSVSYDGSIAHTQSVSTSEEMDKAYVSHEALIA